MVQNKDIYALLLIAFRHSITEPNVEAGFARIQEIAGEKLDTSAFHDALASCLREGLIHEPVRLPEGSLQCHWHLELAPKGVEAVRALLHERAMSADQFLISCARMNEGDMSLRAEGEAIQSLPANRWTASLRSK